LRTLSSTIVTPHISSSGARRSMTWNESFTINKNLIQSFSSV
jgi:hypothetical protein